MSRKVGFDAKLLREAMRLGKHETPSDAVNAALKEYTQRRKQLEILRLFGAIEYDENYDYRRERRRKR